MDEPTAVLSREETLILFDQVRKLRDKGTSFVFVSHKLNEVMELTDRVTVLRDGQWIKTAPTSMMDGEAIAQLMVGREMSSLYPAKREPDIDEEIVLSVRDLTTGYVRGASFELRKGEILGFSGLIGSGRSELWKRWRVCGPALRAMSRSAASPSPSGDIRAANAHGLAYMTKDRKGKGLLLGEGMTVNLTLQNLERHLKAVYLDPRARPPPWSGRGAASTSACATAMSWPAACRAATSRSCCSPRSWRPSPRRHHRRADPRHRCGHQAADLSFHRSACPRGQVDHRRLLGNARGDRPLHPRRVMREGQIVGMLEGEEISEQEIMRYAAGLKQKLAS